MAEFTEMFNQLSKEDQAEVKALVIALLASQQSQTIHTPESQG